MPSQGDPQSLRTNVLTALGLTSSSDVEGLEGFLSSNARSCHCWNRGRSLFPWNAPSPVPHL